MSAEPGLVCAPQSPGWGTLGGTFLCVDRDLTIRAAAGETAVLDGGGKRRVLYNYPGVTATLHGLRITNGSTTWGGYYGGGIWNQGTLSLTNCSVDHCIVGNCMKQCSKGDSGGAGGGVLNDQGATLTTTNCSIDHNYAQECGGIWNDGPMHATHTTICWNAAGDCEGCPPLPPCPPPPQGPAPLLLRQWRLDSTLFCSVLCSSPSSSPTVRPLWPYVCPRARQIAGTPRRLLRPTYFGSNSPNPSLFM